MKKDIVIRNVNNIVFPFDLTCGNGELLLIGELNGAFGTLEDDGNLVTSNWKNNLLLLYETLKNEKYVRLVAPSETIDYMKGVLRWLRKNTDLNGKHLEYFRFSDINIKGNKETELPFNEYIPSKLLEYVKSKNMKFDAIIQNPPYSGSLHLDFLEKGLELLSEKGKMVIVEPATWLINVRKNGKAKKYDEIKKRIEGHVESVVVENLNKDFGTENQVPFATTTIDMSKTFDAIKFVCCGEEREVKSIYDCNLIGNYATVWSVFNKCQKFGDMMDKHFVSVKDQTEKNDVTYNTVVEDQFPHIGWHANTGSNIIENNAKFINQYFEPFVRCFSDTHIGQKREYGKLNKEALKSAVYGSHDEIENWQYNSRNCKLFKFIAISLIFDQHHNNVREFTPWLVDKQYTDEEVNKMFELTEEEIALIDRTIKKFERNSPWFKRYMCGPDSVSDTEVNNFIKSLDNTNA